MTTLSEAEEVARALRDRMKHPQASPYDELPEHYQKHWLETAQETIALFRSLGWIKAEEAAKVADRIGDEDCGCSRCVALRDAAQAIRSLPHRSEKEG